MDLNLNIQLSFDKKVRKNMKDLIPCINIRIHALLEKYSKK